MAWTTIVLVSTGELATASVQNTQVLGNLNELRTGGLAIASQAALDFISASSATQLARLAAVAARFPRVNDAGTAWVMAQVAEADLALTDITTGDVSTAKHGLMPKATGSATTFYRSDGTQATPAGSVSSVALTAAPTGIFDVSGSPITGSGTLALSMDNQSANEVLAGPSSGGAATPAFRALVDADLPAGSIIQVVYGSTVTTATSSSSTLADTNLTATITPVSASHKILVLVTQNGVGKDTNDTRVNTSLLRDATTIATELGAAQDSAADSNFIGTVAFAVLDSPATTSAIVYKTQFASNGNNATAHVQVNGSRSSIVLLEVKA